LEGTGYTVRSSVCVLLFKDEVCLRIDICGRFDDGSEAGKRRPSSQPADRPRNASDLFTEGLFESDDRDWLDMAGNKGTATDRPRSEGNITDKAAPAGPSNNIS